jgi:hypothetical protein
MARTTRPWWKFWQRPVRAIRAMPIVGIRAPRGRVTREEGFGLLPNALVVAPPDRFDDAWTVLHANRDFLEHLSPARLLEVLTDLSPEVSRAYWDFHRMCNPGWEATANRVTASGNEIPHARGQAATNAFMDKLDDYYGSVDVVIGRLFMSAFLRGAEFAELVLDGNGRLPVDLVVPDPITVRFRRVADPVRGLVWQPGQWQDGQFVSLDRPTIRYVPIDPFPDSPYGRALAAPALFVSLFLLGMLHDIRRVVQQQGYPRLDISADTAKLGPQLDAADTDEEQAAIIQQVLDGVADYYKTLQPDDAYIHTDHFTLNRPVGAVDASSLGGIEGLIAALERMITRALKSMPIMMGLSESNTETQSNRQWEIYAAGIKSIQHYTETLLERLLTLALEAQGIQAKVKFRFAELRAAEAMRDAQTETLQIANAVTKRNEGFITQDQASEEITGEVAVGPAPSQAASNGDEDDDVPGDDGDGNEALDQNSDRYVEQVAQRVFELIQATREGASNGNGHK